MGTQSKNNCTPPQPCRKWDMAHAAAYSHHSVDHISRTMGPLQEQMQTQSRNLKVCKQEEGGLRVNRNPSGFSSIIICDFAFQWGWRRNVPAHYCKSRTAGGVCTMTAVFNCVLLTQHGETLLDLLCHRRREAYKNRSEIRWRPGDWRSRPVWNQAISSPFLNLTK